MKRRNVRCKTCGPCLAEDCGHCVYCLDKPKFGGPNKKKCACVKRKCVNLISSKSAIPETVPVVSLADIPVEVVGHPPLDSINQYPDQELQPPQVISSSFTMPVFSEDTVTSIQDDIQWQSLLFTNFKFYV